MTSVSGRMWSLDMMKNPGVTEHVAVLGTMY